MLIRRIETETQALELMSKILEERMGYVDNLKDFFLGVNAMLEFMDNLTESEDFHNAKVCFPYYWNFEFGKFAEWLKKDKGI